MSGKYAKYEHFKDQPEVWVRKDLKGKHRKYCLCHTCKKFFPGEKNNCPIAQATYENCVKFNTVTPMWECSQFDEK